MLQEAATVSSRLARSARLPIRNISLRSRSRRSRTRCKALLRARHQNWPSEAIAFIREIAGGSAVANPSYIEKEPRLDALKKMIRGALPEDNIITASTNIKGSGEVDGTYLAHFASQIESKLKSAIDAHISRIEAIERTPNFALESERDGHRLFAEGRLKIFVGREQNLAAISRYLAAESNLPLVVYGRSALGKTALMARAIKAAETDDGPPVIARFIGATAGSSNSRSLLTSLIEDLAEHGIVSKPDEFEDDVNKFNGQIQDLLSSIAKPVIVFLDALDQLQKPHGLNWLPRQLPEGLRLVLSVLEDPAYATDSGLYRSLRNRLPHELFREIEPLMPKQGHEILSALEQQAQRRLQDHQRDYIIERFKTAEGSPLYLRTAFEIAKGWKSTATPRIGRHVLAEDTGGIIAQFISELWLVHHHQQDLVIGTLGFLAAAKDGLSEKELTEVLSQDVCVMRAISSEKHGAQTDKLPPSVWVRLNRDLSPFLIEKLIDEQPLLQFFHRQVAQVVHVQHYEPVKSKRHEALADYFEFRATGIDGRRKYNKHSLSELPYQLHFAGKSQPLDAILESPDWMQQKFTAFGSQVLISDYEQFGRGEVQNLLKGTLRLIPGICARDKRQLIPQLYGRLLAQPPASNFCEAALRGVNKPALMTSRPSLTPPGAETARLEGHTDGVYALAVLADGRLASGSDDKTIRLWDVASGAETARLEGHTSEIRSLAVVADGRLASGSDDKTIRLWDVASGAETARLEGHTSEIRSLAVLADGRLASGSGSWPFGRPDSTIDPSHNTIRLWDVASGAETARLEGHTGRVTALALLPDGRLASGSEDSTIRLWDVASGAEITRLEVDAAVWCLLALPDGRLASGSGSQMFPAEDNTIRLWDVASGAEITRLEVDAAVWCLLALPDGRLASGSGDNTIRLWDVARGAETARIKGHTNKINALTLLPDGRLASGSSDNTIRLWDVASGAEMARLDGHTGSVEALTRLADGRLASSGLDDNNIRLWDGTSGAEVARLEGYASSVEALTLLADGRLASGSGGNLSLENTIRLWDVTSRTSTAPLGGHTGPITALTLLADGRLASGSEDSTIRLWDVASGPKLAKTIDLWGIASDQELARLEGHSAKIAALTLLADGRLASGSEDSTIRLWDVASGAEITRLEVDAAVWCLLALPDGRLASGSSDNTIRLWDVARGAETARIKGHTNKINALTLLPDGRLASGSSDNTIRLWDVASGAEITRLEVDAAVLSLLVLPDGRLIAGDGLGQLHWLQVLDELPLQSVVQYGFQGAQVSPALNPPAQKVSNKREAFFSFSRLFKGRRNE